jgi:hypothetical protein
METTQTPIIPFELIEAKLAASDDRGFWRVALAVLTEEFVQRHAEENTNNDWPMVESLHTHE